LRRPSTTSASTTGRCRSIPATLTTEDGRRCTVVAVDLGEDARVVNRLLELEPERKRE
jgi:hypothetical protein